MIFFLNQYRVKLVFLYFICKGYNPVHSFNIVQFLFETELIRYEGNHIDYWIRMSSLYFMKGASCYRFRLRTRQIVCFLLTYRYASMLFSNGESWSYTENGIAIKFCGLEQQLPLYVHICGFATSKWHFLKLAWNLWMTVKIIWK